MRFDRQREGNGKVFLSAELEKLIFNVWSDGHPLLLQVFLNLCSIRPATSTQNPWQIRRREREIYFL